MIAAIMVHGGCSQLAEDEVTASRQGCLAAVQAGWELLQAGGDALDAVEAAICVLEDNPVFNAGYGSQLNAVGEVEMDAALMEGRTLAAGGVGAIKGVRNPVKVARSVLNSEAVLLVADGARQFAKEKGLQLCDPAEMITSKQRDKWDGKRRAGIADRKHDTVGCVALDMRGNLAAGTSTGGTNQNAPGRIGDSPLIGCGLYADNLLGACAMTGDGEAITRIVLAKTAIDLLSKDLHPNDAAAQAIEILEQRLNGEAGCILLDRQGRFGWAHNAPNMPCAYYSSGMESPRAFVHKKEDRL